MTTRRLLSVFVFVVFAALQAAPAMGFTDEPTEPTETVTDEPTSGIQPAVEAPPAADDESEQPWTARFLAPLTLLIGLLALVAAFAYYAVRIRRRYRIVD